MVTHLHSEQISRLTWSRKIGDWCSCRMCGPFNCCCVWDSYHRFLRFQRLGGCWIMKKFGWIYRWAWKLVSIKHVEYLNHRKHWHFDIFLAAIGSRWTSIIWIESSHFLKSLAKVNRGWHVDLTYCGRCLARPFHVLSVVDFLVTIHGETLY